MTGFYIVKPKMQIANHFRKNNEGETVIAYGWDKENESVVAVCEEREYFPDKTWQPIYRVVKLGHPIEGSIVVYGKEQFEYYFEIIKPKLLK